jgi:hypothetical protein
MPVTRERAQATPMVAVLGLLAVRAPQAEPVLSIGGAADGDLEWVTPCYSRLTR